MTRRHPHVTRVLHDEPSPNRFWTAPDGTLYRVWLEAAPKRMRGNQDPRGVLTFVDMGKPSRQLIRRVAEGTVLEEIPEDQLGELHGSEGPAQWMTDTSYRVQREAATLREDASHMREEAARLRGESSALGVRSRATMEELAKVRRSGAGGEGPKETR